MNTSIQIDNLDPATFERLRAEAVRRGMAIGAVAGEVLRRGFPPVAPPGAADETEHDDLDALAGTWSAADARAFAEAVVDSGRIDRGLWE